MHEPSVFKLKAGLEVRRHIAPGAIPLYNYVHTEVIP